MLKRPLTVLGKAAAEFEKENGGPFVPWFRDDQKLLQAVLRRAASSHELVAMIAAEVARIAIEPRNKSMRGKLRKALIPDSKQKVGRSPKPLAFCMELATHYRILRKGGAKPGKAREILADRHELSPSRITALVTRGEKLLDLEQKQ